MGAVRITSFVALVAVVPAALAAQGDAGRRFLTGAELRSLSFSDGLGAKRVSVLAVPIGAVLALSPRISLDVGTFYARAERESEQGAKATISGLTDVQARAVVELVPDAVVFTLSANLPTGHATLDSAELDVAGAIASDLIPFPVSNFGSGLSVTSGLAFAMPVGQWALGLAGSYRHSGSFELLSGDTTSYRPGGEARLRIGVERLVGQGRLALGFTYSTFSTDEFAGSGEYRSGARYIPQVSLSLPMGNNNLALYAWNLYRGLGEYTRVSQPAPKENTMTGGAILALPRGRRVLQATVEFRKQWKGTVSMQSAGTLVSLGARYQLPMGARVSLQPGLRFDAGNVVNDNTGASVGFTGFGASLSIRTAL